VFFYYTDRHDDTSRIFSFSDRNQAGNNASATPTPSLSHNKMMPHSIRGRVTPENEGPRYCSACHLTESGVTQFGADYESFRTAMRERDYGALDFPLLQQHIGQNPGNSLESPLWVHMVAGLGSGLFLFDENGCAVNGLDGFAGRKGCTVAPSANPNPAVLNLDRIVDETGRELGSSNHAMSGAGSGDELRLGASNPNMAGPLGADILNLLTDPDTGLVLDSWLDADGAQQGGAGGFVP
jgi:hypothetical protein